MSVTKEQVDVHYCDICGERERPMHSIARCQRCGRDVCPNHWHLVGGHYISLTRGGWFAHLCTDCRNAFSERLEPIFAEFRPETPAPVESRSQPT